MVAATAATGRKGTAINTHGNDDGSTEPADLVVVGVDQTPEARNAARWAAVAADHRRAPLCLVHAYHSLQPNSGSITESASAAQLRADGSALLSRIATGLRRSHPWLAITTHLDQAPPVAALRRRSARAALTVVGSWGTDHPIGLPPLGSVAFAIASSNCAPVAVVHPHHHPNTQGSVVVGIDGPDTAEETVAFAFAEADARRTDLLAIHVWRDVAIGGTFPFQTAPSPTVTGTARARIEEKRAALADQLTRWQRKYPRVPAQPAVIYGATTSALLDLADRAQLLIVGGHGNACGAHTALLGPTAQALVERSSCPVVVVRTPAHT